MMLAVRPGFMFFCSDWEEGGRGRACCPRLQSLGTPGHWATCAHLLGHAWLQLGGRGGRRLVEEVVCVFLLFMSDCLGRRGGEW